MNGNNDVLSILALVNLVFSYAKSAPGFFHKNYRDAKLLIYYDGDFSNGDTTEITLCDSPNGTVVFSHKNGIPGDTSIFRHGAWEEYLEALPGKLQKAKYTLKKEQRDPEEYTNFSDVDDAAFFAKAEPYSGHSLTPPGWEMP